VQPRPNLHRKPAGAPGFGLARVLSKLGFCSRSQAFDLIRAGRVRVGGVIRRDPEWRVRMGLDEIDVDGKLLTAERKVYLLINKPRGLVTTASDERGRATVYQCLEGRGFPAVGPVGRLDQASEGLLLFTNDTAWADRITRPETHLDKCYHVQIDSIPDEPLLSRMRSGVVDAGETLSLKRVVILREGTRNSWLEVTLDEGRNRQIRRVLQVFGIEVLRLIRVSIGPLQLGPLAKGDVRELTAAEVASLR